MKKTEITVQVFDDLENIDKKLKLQGFNLIETYSMKDWYFCKDENVRGLKYEDLMKKSFLLRKVDKKAFICYKMKDFDVSGNVLSEEKIETLVKDFTNAINIFEKAGLNNYCVVENKSFVYKKGKICFVIQDIHNLGIFIEIEEDKTMQKLEVAEKIENMKDIVNKLNLNIGRDYFCKKVFMLLHKDFCIEV